jgi:hypothetical protein
MVDDKGFGQVPLHHYNILHSLGLSSTAVQQHVLLLLNAVFGFLWQRAVCELVQSKCGPIEAPYNGPQKRGYREVKIQ